MTEKTLTIETLENTTINGTQTTKIRINGINTTVKHQPGYVNLGTVHDAPITRVTIVAGKRTRVELTDNQGRTFHAKLNWRGRLKLINPAD